MKFIVFALSFSLTNLISYGQADKIDDTIVNQICQTINERTNLPDSELLVFVYKNKVIPYLANFPTNERDAASDAIFYRLYKNCQMFEEIMNKKTPIKGDWKQVSEKPLPQLSQDECKQFLNYEEYKYLDVNGDTAVIKIKNGLWIDSFKDGTYSKLKFKWIDSCEFSIEFLESNNFSRKNYSKPGDKYNYQILEKHKNYYLMSVENTGSNKFLTFNMYFKN